MDDWRACSVTQLGLYVGLFQLFVADKISHKGCFTLQARCPEMVFLEERSNWESRPGPWAIRAATGYMGQWCVHHLVCKWHEGRVSCSAWGPCTLSPSSAHPQGAESCSHSRLRGEEGDCTGARGPAWTHLSGLPTDKHSKGTCEFLLQEEVSADRQFSELKLFQEILPVLYPACFSLATHQTLLLLWHLVFSTKPQHHQGTSLQVNCKCLHAVFTSSEASELQL